MGASIIGILGVSIDITNMKEAERLKIAHEFDQVIIQQQKDFNLHSSYQPERTILHQPAEECVPLLISRVLSEILTEKKYQYKKRPIKFNCCFSTAGSFAFICAEVSSFKRMLSNFIDSVVEGLEDRHGYFTICLDIKEKKVEMILQDNGKGMSEVITNKINTTIKANRPIKHKHSIGLTHKGTDVAKILHEMGYKNLYLLSGYRFEEGVLPDYLNTIYRSDVENIKKI